MHQAIKTLYTVLHYTFYSFGAFPLSCIFMKLATFLISKTKQIYAKAWTVPESSFEIKAMLPCTLLKILLTSTVICKQRFLHVKRDYAISSKLKRPRR